MFDLVGNKVYEHVKELDELGLVKTKPRKNSVELTTTKRFIETFGIDARSRDEVKAWLEGELDEEVGQAWPVKTQDWRRQCSYAKV